jgi:hypothetical protein
MSMPRIDLSILVVSYNTRALTTRLRLRAGVPGVSFPASGGHSAVADPLPDMFDAARRTWRWISGPTATA